MLHFLLSLVRTQGLNRQAKSVRCPLLHGARSVWRRKLAGQSRRRSLAAQCPLPVVRESRQRNAHAGPRSRDNRRKQLRRSPARLHRAMKITLVDALSVLSKYEGLTEIYYAKESD